MQNRMKQNQLTEEQMDTLIEKSQVGHLAMIDLDSKPYVIPIHYIYENDKIYFHGLPKGEKVDNIKNNNNVCLEICEMLSILIDEEENICDTNTEYNSVIVRGVANTVEDLQEKERILGSIVSKYTPQFTGRKLPENMIKGTLVIEIEIHKKTGKYYK